MRQNLVLTVFHTQNICVENSQNHTLMFCFSLILQRRLEKQGKLWDRFVPYFFSISWPFLHDWRPTMHCSVVLTVFHTLWYIFCVWKTVRTTLQCMVGLQSWRKGHEMEKNFGTNLSHSFPCFSNLLCRIKEKQNIKVWFWEFSTT